MSKKKNKQKKMKKSEIRDVYKVLGRRTISIRELTDEVNKMDKSFGIRLKHPDVWRNPRIYRERIEAETERNIMAMMCCINGIDPILYLGKSSSIDIKRPIPKHPKPFTYYSAINWEDNKTKFSTDSLTFRCRFVTLCLANLIGNVGKITDIESKKKYVTHHSYDERRIMLTKDIAEYALKFTTIMTNPDASYSNIILKMNNILSYTKKKGNQPKLAKVVHLFINEGRTCLKPEVWNKKQCFYDDDDGIFNVLESSYCLATNDWDCRCLPSFKHIQGATLKHDLLKLIEKLGEEILNTKSPKKFSPMFKAFIQAHPSIWTEYGKEAEENLAVKIGLYSLAYSKFVYGEKYVDKFINKMMVKGA